MKIESIDHFVLTVRDIEQTCAFYARVLGMTPVIFGEGRRALAFGTQKINLHEAGKPHPPVARHPTPGAADFCLITDVPIAQVVRHLIACEVEIEQGPVDRTGARGALLSVYFRDPDRNLVEVANCV